MKVGTTDLLKFKKLQRRLDLLEWQATGLLETLWQKTIKNAPAGDIGKLSDEDIVALIDWRGETSELIETLIEFGWLDRDPEYRLIVHDWSQHAPNFLKANFAKHGKAFADIVAKQRAKEPLCAPKNATTKPSQAKPIQSSSPSPLRSAMPSSASPPDDGTATPDGDDEGLLVIGKLRTAGVRRAREAFELARSRGLSGTDVAAIVEHFERKNCWNGAQLYERLKSAEPGESPDVGWLDPDPAKAKAASRNLTGVADRKRDEDRQRQKAEDAAERKRLADLEKRYGAELDAMPAEAFERVAVQAIGENQVLRSALRKQGRKSSVVRSRLLAVLEGSK
jgi:hypothetical protein